VPSRTLSHSYGAHGEQIINITYVGDTLVASKVTGDTNVPRGQTTFTADLSPSWNESALQPLPITVGSHTTHLDRYAGKGQVAQEGFIGNRFVDGQLVILESCFSFVWMPLRHQVVFKRPTPEQTIALLRDIYSQEDELENMREHLTRCLDMDMTDSIARYHAKQGPEPFRRIMQTSDLHVLQEAVNVPNKMFRFWDLGMIRKYIDRALEKKESEWA
jgi:Cyclin D1 binding domain